MPLSVCTITGTAYYANGSLGDANIYITADQISLNGAVIGSAAQTFYAAAVGGVITLVLPRGSTARLYGNVRGFHDAIVVAIPDSATADLEDLIPVQYSGSLPQGLGTGSSPTFAGLTLNGDPTTSVQVKRNSANFDKTDGTLSNVTGLSVDVDAGGIYSFRAVLHVLAEANGGGQVAISGTATATTFRGHLLGITAEVTPILRSAEMAFSSGAFASPGTSLVFIEGSIVVNTAGTLTVQFAQSSEPFGTSTVKAGSTFEVKRAA